MNNIDYRLDLYNSIKGFVSDMDCKHDSLFVVWHNMESGEIVSVAAGDVNILSAACSNDAGYHLFENQKQRDTLKNIQGFVLNIAMNVLRTNPDKINDFVKAVKDSQ